MARVLVLAGEAASLVNFRGQLMQSMRVLGHEVIACAAPDADCSVTLQQWGIEFRPIDIGRAGLNPFEDLLLLFRLIRLCKSINPDVVLSYTIKPVIYGSLAARISGVKNTYALITGLGHAFLATGLHGLFLRKVASFLYRVALLKAKVIFFQNPDDCEYFKSLRLVNPMQKTVIVNGSGVDLDHFQPAALPDKPIFLFIGRLLTQKGIVEYGTAAARVKQMYPDASFYLVGGCDVNPSGLRIEEIETLVNSGAIQYLGKLADVRPALKECSVFVLPSYREGTPRAVLEAMAMGRPIITTDAPGCRETVQHGVNGLLIRTKDVDSLVDAMERLIRDPETRFQMGRASRELAVEKYDVRKVNTVMLEMMELV